MQLLQTTPPKKPRPLRPEWPPLEGPAPPAGACSRTPGLPASIPDCFGLGIPWGFSWVLIAWGSQNLERQAVCEGSGVLASCGSGPEAKRGSQVRPPTNRIKTALAKLASGAAHQASLMFKTPPWIPPESQRAQCSSAGLGLPVLC